MRPFFCCGASHCVAQFSENFNIRSNGYSKLFYIILLTKCLKSDILVSSNERGECEMHNKKNFEVRATKNGQTATFYVVSYVYDGIASDIASMYEQDGYSDVTVRIA